MPPANGPAATYDNHEPAFNKPNNLLPCRTSKISDARVQNASTAKLMSVWVQIGNSSASHFDGAIASPARKISVAMTRKMTVIESQRASETRSEIFKKTAVMEETMIAMPMYVKGIAD